MNMEIITTGGDADPGKTQGYVQNNGAFCLWCHSENLVSGNPENNPFEATIEVEVTCQDCHKSWYEVYRLSGVNIP